MPVSAVDHVTRSLENIRSTGLRRDAAERAVHAYEKWLASEDGRPTLLRLVLEGGYRVGRVS